MAAVLQHRGIWEVLEGSWVVWALAWVASVVRVSVAGLEGDSALDWLVSEVQLQVLPAPLLQVLLQDSEALFVGPMTLTHFIGPSHMLTLQLT
mmetsp:Transcript_25797/g.56106  ORF Transcript_25797/g.56106 Transcript_25797/m.56106 type:complete len:93 (-) Transcript_25797:1409-1687(-)